MKPVNQSGNYCPLVRGKCSEHCHECEFWRAMYQTGQQGNEQAVYNCVFIWNMHIAGMSNSRLDGNQKAVESMRNEFLGFRKSINALLAALVSFRPGPPTNDRPPMKEIDHG